jgi:hypothetical protein
MTALSRCAPTLTLALLAACAEPERATPREIVHPVAEHLLSTNARALGVLRLDSARVQALPFAGADALGERTFGASTGSEQEVFGEIVSAELLPSGRLLLLDASSGLIRVLGATGVSGVVGGLGEGPGELMEPTRLFSHRDSLLVLDAERALHVFAMAEGGLPRYVRTMPLPFAVEDACSTPQGVLVLAAPIMRGDDGRPALGPSRGSLHRLDADGQVVTSFHVPYRATSATVVRALLAGRLLCSPSDGTITVAYSSLGEVHHLTADGELVWMTRLPQHSYPPLREDPGGAVGPVRDFRGPIDQLGHLAGYGDSLLVVSITTRHITEAGRSSTHRLGILQRHDGTFLGDYADETIASVLFGTSSQFLLYRDLPFPTVSVRGVR